MSVGEENNSQSQYLLIRIVLKNKFLRRLIFDHVSIIHKQLSRVRIRERVVEVEPFYYKGPGQCVKTFHTANNIRWLLANGYTSLLYEKYKYGHLFEKDLLYSWVEVCTETNPIPSGLLDNILKTVQPREITRLFFPQALVGGNLMLLEKLIKHSPQLITLETLASIYSISCQHQNQSFKQIVVDLCVKILPRLLAKIGEYNSTNSQPCASILKMLYDLYPTISEHIPTLPQIWSLYATKQLLLELNPTLLKILIQDYHLITFNVMSFYDFIENLLQNPMNLQKEHIMAMTSIWESVMYHSADLFTNEEEISERLAKEIGIKQDWEGLVWYLKKPFTFRQLVNLFLFIDNIVLMKVEYRTLGRDLSMAISFILYLDASPEFGGKIINYCKKYIRKELLEFDGLFDNSSLWCQLSVVQLCEEEMIKGKRIVIYAPMVYGEPRVLEYLCKKYTYQQETLEKILLHSCKNNNLEMVRTINKYFPEIFIAFLNKQITEASYSGSQDVFLWLMDSYPHLSSTFICTSNILINYNKSSYFILKMFNRIYNILETLQIQWSPGVLKSFINLAMMFCNIPVIKKLMSLPQAPHAPIEQISLGYAIPNMPIIDFFMNPNNGFPSKHFKVEYYPFCWNQIAITNEPNKLEEIFKLTSVLKPQNEPYDQNSIITQHILPLCFRLGHLKLILHCLETYGIQLEESFLNKSLITQAMECNSTIIVKYCIKLIQSNRTGKELLTHHLSREGGNNRHKKQKPLKIMPVEPKITLLKFMFNWAISNEQKEMLKLLSPIIKGEI